MSKLKNELIALRLETETRQKLEKIAEEKERSLSNLIRIILKNYLKNEEL